MTETIGAALTLKQINGRVRFGIFITLSVICGALVGCVFPKMWLYCLSGMLLRCYGMGLDHKRKIYVRHFDILLMSIKMMA